jgi:glycine hydroxymethyltransferase
LATALLGEGVTLITGGTDNHLFVIDTMASFGLDGRAAEETLAPWAPRRTSTMRTGNMRRRIKAANFILRNTEAGRRGVGG